MRYLFCLLILCLSIPVKGQKNTVPFVAHAPKIDGIGNDPAWAGAPWQPLDQLWAGMAVPASDLSGRYKVIAAKDALYVLAEITDDTLVDIQPDPTKRWWDDDCLEIFIDPDASGGNHQYSHQAFAYHIALAGNVIDLGTDSQAIDLSSHVQSRRITTGNLSVWECRVNLFDSTFQQGKPGQIPLLLEPGQKVGFALAYCDNDHSQERETFLGSMPIPGENKNRAYIDASMFTKLVVVQAHVAPAGHIRKRK